MVINRTKLSVSFGDVNQSGVVEENLFSSWLEIGRAALLKDLKMEHEQLEKLGLLLLLVELRVKFHAMVRQEDTQTITTLIRYMPTVRLVFDYEVHNQLNTRILSGETTHAFVDAKTKRLTRVPAVLEKVLEGYFY